METNEIINDYLKLAKGKSSKRILELMENASLSRCFESMKELAYLLIEHSKSTKEQKGKAYEHLIHYYNDFGKELDLGKYRECLLEGYKLKNPRCTAKLGLEYILPNPDYPLFQIDYDKGIELIKKSIDLKSAFGMYVYADFLKTEGFDIVEYDLEKSLEYMEMAFENGWKSDFDELIKLNLEVKGDKRNALRWACIGSFFGCDFSEEYLNEQRSKKDFENLKEKVSNKIIKK